MESNDSKQGMQSQSATLCKAGCGFYGSSSSDGYCSVCFKQKLQRRLLLSEGVSAAAPSPSSCNPPASDDSADQIEENEAKAAVRTQKTESTNDDAPANLAVQTTEDASATPAPSADEAPKPPAKNGESSQEGPSQEPLDLRKKPQEAAVEDELKEQIDGGESLKKKNRCFICKKKVGLTGFGCRCGGLFCGLHRYSDTHDCNFDYKEQGQLEIRKNNPKVTFQKVTKI